MLDGCLIISWNGTDTVSFFLLSSLLLLLLLVVTVDDGEGGGEGLLLYGLLSISSIRDCHTFLFVSSFPSLSSSPPLALLESTPEEE